MTVFFLRELDINLFNINTKSEVSLRAHLHGFFSSFFLTIIIKFQATPTIPTACTLTEQAEITTNFSFSLIDAALSVRTPTTRTVEKIPR